MGKINNMPESHKESEKETGLVSQTVLTDTEKAIEQAVSLAIEKTIPQVMLAVTHTLTLRNENSPIPSAAEMTGYENILPGATNRLLTAYENQIKARMENETYLLVTDRKSRMGENFWKTSSLFLAFIMALCFFSLIAYYIHKEIIWGSAALLSSGVCISIFSIFKESRSNVYVKDGLTQDANQNFGN